MYYIAQPPPLVGGSLVVPGALALPVPYGDQEEYGYRTTAGMGVISSRTSLGSTGLLASGTLYLSFFRACKPATLSRWDAATTTQGFAATPTLIRGGLYIVDSLGNLTLAAASANDTTIGTAGSTKFGKVFTAPVAVEFGRLYAWGFLVVSGATMATLLGPTVAFGSQNVAMLSDPRVNGILSAQADLPASIAFASVAASNQLLWAELS